MNQFFPMVGTCWLVICGANDPNTVPLAFGMTPHQAEIALGMPLTEIDRREIYVVDGNAPVPGVYTVGEHLYLQFRKGHLTGWKYDWRLRPHFPF